MKTMHDTREKLIELRREAEEIAENFCVSRMECYQCPYDPTKWCQEGIIADHLIANGVTIQKWIPVTERLPEEGERVLFTDGVWTGEGYINKRGKWQRYQNQSYMDVMVLDVTHWMPLPEPPKEVSP